MKKQTSRMHAYRLSSDYAAHIERLADVHTGGNRSSALRLAVALATIVLDGGTVPDTLDGAEVNLAAMLYQLHAPGKTPVR